MSTRRLSEVAAVTGGKLVGADREFLRVGTDTRKLMASELYVALRGAHFNGHLRKYSNGRANAYRRNIRRHWIHP